MRAAQELANLRLVERVYEEVLGPIDSSAVDALFDPGYIQHNPSIATGAEALKAMLDRAKAKYPHAEHRVKRMIADGDLVMAHVHVIFEPGTPGLAAVQEKSGSAIAVLGYSGSVAIAHVLLPMWGAVIVALMSGNVVAQPG